MNSYTNSAIVMRGARGCGGFTDRQLSSISELLSHTAPPQKNRGRKYDEKRLELRIGRPLPGYHHRQNRLRVTEVKVIYCLLLTD